MILRRQEHRDSIQWVWFEPIRDRPSYPEIVWEMWGDARLSSDGLGKLWTKNDNGSCI